MAMWTDEDVAALKAYYPSKGAHWGGWDEWLPTHTHAAIYSKAKSMGLSWKRKGPQDVVLSVRTCGECMYYREDGGGHGRCAERHAVGLFGRAPEVLACFDAGLCAHRCERVVL